MNDFLSVKPSHVQDIVMPNRVCSSFFISIFFFFLLLHHLLLLLLVLVLMDFDFSLSTVSTFSLSYIICTCLFISTYIQDRHLLLLLFLFFFFFFFFSSSSSSNIYKGPFCNLSRLIRKPTICIYENKDADQLRGDQRLCFRYSDSTIPLLLKSEISSF